MPSRAHVLLIDDDPDVRESLRRMIALEHDVEAVGSVERANALLEERTFDLVVCDLVMPGRSGLGFIEEAARRWPELPKRIVLMTGALIDPEQTALFEELGVQIVQKPIGLRDFESLLAERLGSPR